MTPQEFLTEMAETANKLDFEAHMNLISKDVAVYGIPGYDIITYEEWHKQCEHEFENKILKQVTFDGLNIIKETPERKTFRSIETIEGTDGAKNSNGLEFIIQKEADGCWRVVSERVLLEYELESDRYRGLL